MLEGSKTNYEKLPKQSLEIELQTGGVDLKHSVSAVSPAQKTPSIRTTLGLELHFKIMLLQHFQGLGSADPQGPLGARCKALGSRSSSRGAGVEASESLGFTPGCLRCSFM